jgi:hypothetical protein
LTHALSGPVFEPLRDEARFSAFRADEELATIVGANGADMAPEFPDFRAFKENPELQERFKPWGYSVLSYGQTADP